jgi:uncharacterized protein
MRRIADPDLDRRTARGTKLTFAQLPETGDEQTFTPPRLRAALTQIRCSSTAWNTVRLVALPG